MGLRNKKTGEIVDVESLGHAESLKEKYGYQVTLSWKTEYENLSQCKDYESLAELNEDWEDYEPVKPLIKDEKIRKAVRAWAEVCGLSYVTYKQASNEFYDPDTRGAFAIRFRLIPVEVYLEDGECYTIDELCGEEKE